MKLLGALLVSILLCPAISFADELDDLRAALDPIMYRVRGVSGSMIGGCIKGTDIDPFANGYRLQEEVTVEPCLIYLVKTEKEIPYVRSEYQKLKISNSVAVRFQKDFPIMIEQ
jgi:hypothetical protein